MEEKTVLMVLKVDLQCDRCFKKVKKVLAKIPQIRDQAYNEKQGIVLIKVVCCKPEMIMNKICCKGNGSIKSIEIKEPEKNKEEKKGGEKPKVVAQLVRGYSPPPDSVYCYSCYEGRPCYRCHVYGIPAAPPCYVGMPVYDSYGGGYGGSGYCHTGCSVM
ncbi:protein PYRICULARIA ORYZAE RESISTANCE 21-like [Cucurbita moschata]|uniref:Protein PYRICULARIA ORYZAE RESISTANCE 21-like n=2 Tax=Cucurbita TaxID=3660 RepID=A0A6J1GE23_CUCMO